MERLPAITTEGNLSTQSELANEEVSVVLREHDMIDTVFKVGFKHSNISLNLCRELLFFCSIRW